MNQNKRGKELKSVELRRFCPYCRREIESNKYFHPECEEEVKNYPRREFADYQGELLPINEVEALIDIEDAVKKPIPRIQFELFLLWMRFGFSGSVTGLTHLFLSECNLASIPESIGQFSQLNELRLLNNRLTTLPEYII